ncbi:MAG TPA: acetone carboxylase subunit alpha [Chloroflexi bacterium]|nr:acetone carboxylase subunit alpha [Chloroflexota bacterium]
MTTATATQTQTQSKPVGWNGQTLKEMLAESDRLVAETGRYYGLEELPLRENQPILYEKIFSHLRGGLVNARATALNISASPIVKEIGELCFALYTPEGDSIALSTGIIVHVHTISDAIKYMIRHNWEKNPGIRDGYIFCNNNSMIGDVHTADVHTIIPIFWEEELIGWAAGVTHEIDVGGISPGSMCYGHADRYGDGLLVSCELVGENDEFHEDYLLRCRESVRAEMYWVLDEKTRLTGCQLIRDQVYRTIEEVGIDSYKQFIREAIEEGRRSFIGTVRQMTFPGEYEAPAFMDVPWKDDPTVHPMARKDVLMHSPLKISITGEGHMDVSFEGANKWDFHSFNCAPSPMQGAMWVLLTQTLFNSDKINDGAYFASSTHLPYGSWCNPDFEKVSTTLTWLFLIPGFTGMMRSLSRAYFARGFLEEISASYPCTFNLLQGGGINHFGAPSAFTNFELSSQGTGALYYKDGEAACAAMWNPEGDMGEMETWEFLEPLIYLGRAIKSNSGGHGKYRGGMGMESLRMLFKTQHQVMFTAGEGHVFGSYGIFGGYPGNSGYRHSMHGTNMKEIIAEQKPYPLVDGNPEESQMSSLVDAEQDVFDLHQLSGPHPFGEYDLYASIQRGGPGLGDPLERDPKAVEADLNAGDLLPRFAENVYGVAAVNDNGVWTVDLEATEKRRQEMRRERLAKAIDAQEFIAKERERVLNRDFIPPVYDMFQSSMALSPSWREKFYGFWGLPDDFEF